jgi:hypothetical protein
MSTAELKASESWHCQVKPSRVMAPLSPCMKNSPCQRKQFYFCGALDIAESIWKLNISANSKLVWTKDADGGCPLEKGKHIVKLSFLGCTPPYCFQRTRQWKSMARNRFKSLNLPVSVSSACPTYFNMFFLTYQPDYFALLYMQSTGYITLLYK